MKLYKNGGDISRDAACWTLQCLLKVSERASGFFPLIWQYLGGLVICLMAHEWQVVRVEFEWRTRCCPETHQKHLNWTRGCDIDEPGVAEVQRVWVEPCHALDIYGIAGITGKRLRRMQEPDGGGFWKKSGLQGLMLLSQQAGEMGPKSPQIW